LAGAEGSRRHREEMDQSAELPRVLAVMPGVFPSTIMGAVLPLVGLSRRGSICCRITLEQFVSGGVLKTADMAVFCRNMEPRYQAVLDETLRLAIPIIYDIDDNLLALQPEPGSREAAGWPARQAMLRRYLRSADLVRVYSRPMEEAVRELTPRVERVTPPVYLDLVDPPRRSPTRVRIVYATSRTRGDRLAGIVVPALESILKDYGNRVEVHFWGHTPDSLRGRANVYSHRFILDYGKFMRVFSRAGYDIGLAPGFDDLFHNSKTNLKFRDYGACRIAGIYSNVPLYSDCVVPGASGLLVENTPEAWRDAIAQLIEDKALRERIQEEAYQYVTRVHSAQQFEEQWLAQIRRLVAATGDAGKLARIGPRGRGPSAEERGSPSPVSKLWSFWRCFSLAKILVLKGPVQAFRSAHWFARSILVLARVRRAARRPAHGSRRPVGMGK